MRLAGKMAPGNGVGALTTGQSGVSSFVIGISFSGFAAGGGRRADFAAGGTRRADGGFFAESCAAALWPSEAESAIISAQYRGLFQRIIRFRKEGEWVHRI